MVNNDKYNKESIILRKLYLTQYRKKMFGRVEGCYEDFMNDINDKLISESYMLLIFRKLVEKGVLSQSSIKNNKIYYLINRKRIIDLLKQDIIFMLDYEIISQEWTILD